MIYFHYEGGFHIETSRTFGPHRESKTHPHPHRALSGIEYSALLQVLVSGNRRSVILQPLLSDTRYKITVTPIYADGESTALSKTSTGKTREYEWTNAAGVLINEIHYVDFFQNRCSYANYILLWHNYIVMDLSCVLAPFASFRNHKINTSLTHSHAQLIWNIKNVNNSHLLNV